MLLDAKYPQFVDLDASVKENYLLPLIDKHSSTVFAGRQQTEVYLIACAIGFKNHVRKPTKTIANIRTYEGLTDNQKMFVRTIAIAASDFDFDVIFDGKKTLNIIEEFANGGFPILKDMVYNTPALNIDDDLREVFRNIQTKGA